MPKKKVIHTHTSLHCSQAQRCVWPVAYPLPKKNPTPQETFRAPLLTTAKHLFYSNIAEIKKKKKGVRKSRAYALNI